MQNRQADVDVMDICMPGLDGIAATREIKNAPDLGAVVAHEGDKLVTGCGQFVLHVHSFASLTFILVGIHGGFLDCRVKLLERHRL